MYFYILSVSMTLVGLWLRFFSFVKKAMIRTDILVSNELFVDNIQSKRISVPHKASSASCFCGLSSVSKRLY
ncbi:hypothetical protein SAMN05444271_13732 [Halohasta litchfieldiae]|uniref:Uncharacterized protein n=1 Tax=Halohasta litchfieldiae TaxID=1073996 RepID=A0A1H6XBY0_9EURY|nr:hypothetical protein SAMN05444271_13732 [Halohasta litchfieldiae]